MPPVYVDGRIGELPTEPQRVLREMAQEINATAGYMFVGDGSPETVIAANVGSVYLRKDGAAGTSLYVKQASSGSNTGWSAFAAPAAAGPAFSAYNSGTQAIASSTYTKATFNAEYFDTNACFASSRFTPNVAGYYQLNTSIYTGSAGLFLVALYKNGAIYQEFGRIATSGTIGGGATVNANGSSDYFEVFAFSTAAAPVLGYASGPYYMHFSGALVRAA